MKKILITGAAGFIGSHLAQRFKDEELTLLDNFSRGKQSYLDYLGVKTPVKKVDLRDYPASKKAFGTPDIVYHCASRIGGMQFLHGSPEKEAIALLDNLAIDRNVFKLCYETGVKKIIFTSSVSVYNTYMQNFESKFSEKEIDNPYTDPEGGYGWAKYTAEKELAYLSQSGIQTGIARIFKSYGPCDDYSRESGQVVCSLMRKILNKEEFTVWGDGSASRCLLYIDDLTDALVLLENYNKSLTVNIGAEKGTSIKNLAEKIVQISGKDINIKFDKSQPSGPRTRVPDLRLAKKLLKWEPIVDLETGLRSTWKWMTKQTKEWVL